MRGRVFIRLPAVKRGRLAAEKRILKKSYKEAGRGGRTTFEDNDYLLLERRHERNESHGIPGGKDVLACAEGADWTAWGKQRRKISRRGVQ